MSEVLGALKMLGVKPIGSRHAEGMISLEIEGHAVPDVAKVMCEITTVEGAHTVTLTARFLTGGSDAAS